VLPPPAVVSRLSVSNAVVELQLDPSNILDVCALPPPAIQNEFLLPAPAEYCLDSPIVETEELAQT